MKSRLRMPPIALVSGIFAAHLDQVIVRRWKGSMQTPKKGSAASMPLRICEPRLLQDFFQRSHGILSGNEACWNTGEWVVLKPYKDSWHPNPSKSSVPSISYLDLLVLFALIKAKQACEHLLCAGAGTAVNISHCQLWIGVLQELVPCRCAQSRSNKLIDHKHTALHQLLCRQKWAWNSKGLICACQNRIGWDAVRNS